MEQIQALLVDVPANLSDLATDHQRVLGECLGAAAALARQYKSKVILFSHVYASGASLETWLQGTVLNNVRDDMVQKQLLQLESFAKPLREKQIEVELRAVWAKNIDDALKDNFQDGDFDLVIQPSRHHLFAASIVRQPNEWRMIRFPKVPVILQQKLGLLSGRVLLALDVGEVEISQDGNKAIIRQLKQWCEATESELHLLNAYPSAADLMAFAPAEWTVPQIQNTLQEQHLNRLQALAAECGVDTACVHVAEGPVAQVIEDQAKELDASLVALTSHCRRGISGFMIGNTAELVLEHTHLNLLVLKPLHD